MTIQKKSEKTSPSLFTLFCCCTAKMPYATPTDEL